MGVVIAVTGKGGSGKTLVSTLLVRYLIENKKGYVLAIDADPDSNLAESLGIEYNKTVGDIREELSSNPLPPGVEKKNYLDSKIFESTTETKNFDFIVMGRPEGPGCYCAINHMLRQVIDSMTNAYDFTIIDAEAGLEHLSRRTTQNADIMLVVTDPSKKGFHTANSIKEMVKGLEIDVEKIYLILNKYSMDLMESMDDSIKETGLEVLGKIQLDDEVRRFDSKGIPLMELPENSIAYRESNNIFRRLLNEKS